MRTPAPPRDAHRRRARGRQCGQRRPGGGRSPEYEVRGSAKKILKKPLTSGSRSAIIRAQVEARQSPDRVRPMRVRKSEPMKPPQGKRGILCGIRGDEPRDPKGFKCAPIPPSGLKGGSGILNHTKGSSETHCRRKRPSRSHVPTDTVGFFFMA